MLRALARLEDPVSGRQLAKLAGAGNHSTAQRYLHRLLEIGLVHGTETTAASLYRLNRHHVYSPAIKEILDSPAAVDRAVTDLVERELGPSARVAAFGSVAMGTAGPRSDYDLLLVVDDDVSQDDRTRFAARLAELVSTITGNEGQIVDVSVSELRDLIARGSPLAEAWKSTARPLDGRGPIALLTGSA